MEQYAHHPTRWIEPKYRALRLRSNLTAEEAVERSKALFQELRKTMPSGTILSHGLDNPYMHEHARRTLISLIFHEIPSRTRYPKRKAVAA